MRQVYKWSIGLLFIFFIGNQFLSAEGVEGKDKIKTFTEENFKKEIKSGIVLVDFWATWCYPCKVQGKILHEVAGKVDKNVKIGKVDTDKNREISSIYNIRSIPTIIIFKDGRIVKRFVGVQDEQTLLKTLKSIENE